MNWLTELFWDLAGSPIGWIVLAGVALGIALWGPSVVDLMRVDRRRARRR